MCSLCVSYILMRMGCLDIGQLLVQVRTKKDHAIRWLAQISCCQKARRILGSSSVFQERIAAPSLKQLSFQHLLIQTMPFIFRAHLGYNTKALLKALDWFDFLKGKTLFYQHAFFTGNDSAWNALWTHLTVRSVHSDEGPPCQIYGLLFV